MPRRPTQGDARRAGDFLRRASTDDENVELLMPVTDDHALRQFEIEALRQITDNLRRLNDKMDKQSDDIRSIDTRLIRIESNSVNATVQGLVSKVDALEADKDRRDGATGLLNWALKNWPAILGFIALVLIVLKSNGKLQ